MRLLTRTRWRGAHGGAGLRPAPPSKMCTQRPAPPSAPAQMDELSHPAAGPRPTWPSSPGWQAAPLTRPGRPRPCALLVPRLGRPGRGRKFRDGRAAARLDHRCAFLAALAERLLLNSHALKAPRRPPSTSRECHSIHTTLLIGNPAAGQHTSVTYVNRRMFGPAEPAAESLENTGSDD
jgi:hypothetical protein